MNFKNITNNIIKTYEYKKLMNIRHHHKTTTYHHSIRVAKISYIISRSLMLNVNFKSLIIGALLHDFYLYDHNSNHKKSHLTTHPLIARKNAIAIFNINEIEKDIISNHMFPITKNPPKTLEGIIVCVCDKLASIYEILFL